MRILLVLITFFGLQMMAAGQSITTFDNIEGIKEECKKVVDLFANSEENKAFERMSDIWILPADEIASLETQTIKQLNMVEGRFGSVIGSKLVKEDLLDKLLYRLTYVMKFERHGIRLIFTFYNGKDNQWMMNSFQWDNSIADLFD